MHKIEILITHKDTEQLRDILDTVLRHAMEIIRIFVPNVQGVVLYNVPEEKEEEKDEKE